MTRLPAIVRTCTLVALTALIATISLADLPPRIEIKPPEVMWQSVSDQIEDVFVAPDGRAWYVIRGFPKFDLAGFKAMIEREFTKPDPQIQGGWPLLFEPSGRIWFTMNWNNEQFRPAVLGYDGKTWIEHPATKGVGFNGVPRNHGRVDLARGSNCYVDGHALFVCGHTVHDFDGKDWTTQQFWDAAEDRTRDYAPKLIPAPDGKTVIALLPRGPNRLMRWRGGKWDPIGTPPEAIDYVINAAPTDEGVWLLLGGGRLVFTRFDAPVRTLADYVKQLDDPAVRAGLEAAGAPLVPALQELAAKKDLSPKVRAKLTDLIAALKTRTARTPWLNPPPVSFGPFTIEGARFLYCDELGRIFVGGLKVSRKGRGPEPAIVMRDTDNQFAALWGNEFVNRWVDPQLAYEVQSAPIMANNHQVWLPGNGRDVPASLLDVRKGKIIVEAPDPKFATLQSARSDGTLYVKTGALYAPADQRHLAVFSPGKADDRTIIKDETPVQVGRAFCVADDGCVWAANVVGELTRFANDRWEAVDELSNLKGVSRLIAGNGGSVLIQHNTGWTLASKKDQPTAMSLEQLIRDHTRAFAAAFGAGAPPGYSGNEPTFAVDKDGHVWLSQRPNLHLQVLSGEKWIDATPAYKTYGMRRGFVTFAWPVGDGSRIYTSDFRMRHDDGGSALAHLDGEKVMLEAVPHGFDEKYMRSPVRESNGALWVFGTSGAAQSTSDLITGEFAARLTEKGETARVDRARPLYADAHGNVFLANVSRQVGGSLIVWRDGKTVSTLDVGSIDGNTQMFSDRAHSVLVTTSLGFQRLDEDPKQPGHFAKSQVLSPILSTGSPVAMHWSKLGYLVVQTRSRYPDDKYFIHLLATSATPAKKPR